MHIVEQKIQISEASSLRVQGKNNSANFAECRPVEVVERCRAKVGQTKKLQLSNYVNSRSLHRPRPTAEAYICISEGQRLAEHKIQRDNNLHKARCTNGKEDQSSLMSTSA